MKTWMMLKDRVRKSIPNQHFLSNLRSNRNNLFELNGAIPKTTKKERCHTECYPARFYAYHLITSGIVTLLSVGLIAGYAPEVAQFMGLL